MSPIDDGSVKIVHQPVLFASSLVRNEVTSVPKRGTIQITHSTTSTSLVSQPALAGLASKWAAFLRVVGVGAAAIGVVRVSVMRWPPRPGSAEPGRS